MGSGGSRERTGPWFNLEVNVVDALQPRRHKSVYHGPRRLKFLEASPAIAVKVREANVAAGA